LVAAALTVSASSCSPSAIGDSKGEVCQAGDDLLSALNAFSSGGDAGAAVGVVARAQDLRATIDNAPEAHSGSLEATLDEFLDSAGSGLREQAGAPFAYAPGTTPSPTATPTGSGTPSPDPSLTAEAEELQQSASSLSSQLQSDLNQIGC
jgi:hypothetical protein